MFSEYVFTLATTAFGYVSCETNVPHNRKGMNNNINIVRDKAENEYELFRRKKEEGKSESLEKGRIKTIRRKLRTRWVYSFGDCDLERERERETERERKREREREKAKRNSLHSIVNRD